jgi:hypothetical protein
MKWNRLWNAPPRNPTQTALNRFQRRPYGEIRSAFTDSQDSFAEMNPLGKRELEHPFSDILGPLVLGGGEE